jgi:phage/plasmid-associated DNA primase
MAEIEPGLTVDRTIRVLVRRLLASVRLRLRVQMESEFSDGEGDEDEGEDFSKYNAEWFAAQPEPPKRFALTEDGVALAFAARFRDQLKYCHHTGAWFRWISTHWQREETKSAFSWARKICREFTKGISSKIAATLSKAATAAAVERFAQSDRAFAVTSDIWDSDPMLLGSPRGTVDLRTGALRPAIQSDFITKITSVAPAETAICPLWLKFLKETTGDDEELIRFLQQWSGYCLTGDTREHALLFVYGPGGNGKSVWLTPLPASWPPTRRTPQWIRSRHHRTIGTRPT